MLITIKPSTLNRNHVGHYQTIYPKQKHVSHYQSSKNKQKLTFKDLSISKMLRTLHINPASLYFVHTVGTLDLSVLELITSYQCSEQLSQYLLYPLFNSSIFYGIQTEIFK